MSQLKGYYQKKQLMRQLSEELAKLEEDQAVKKDMEFKDRIQSLMEEFGKTPRETFEVLTIIDPGIQGKREPLWLSGKGPKRPLQTFTNPHTGEVVNTRGGNHKKLKEWKAKYGKVTVDTWKKK